jgi:hypothetical protein
MNELNIFLLCFFCFLSGIILGIKASYGIMKDREKQLEKYKAFWEWSRLPEKYAFNLEMELTEGKRFKT